MKKLKQAWIFSDSIIGHELQSKALADSICQSTHIYHCGLRQPWLSFAPRILPGFGKNIIWKNSSKPDIKNLPDIIITTGRRMAAIGKHFKRKYHLKHVQILNPKDSPKNYDVLICPEHVVGHVVEYVLSTMLSNMLSRAGRKRRRAPPSYGMLWNMCCRT